MRSIGLNDNIGSGARIVATASGRKVITRGCRSIERGRSTLPRGRSDVSNARMVNDNRDYFRLRGVGRLRQAAAASAASAGRHIGAFADGSSCKTSPSSAAEPVRVIAIAGGNPRTDARFGNRYRGRHVHARTATRRAGTTDAGRPTAHGDAADSGTAARCLAIYRAAVALTGSAQRRSDRAIGLR
jgi:hypothetical protein